MLRIDDNDAIHDYIRTKKRKTWITFLCQSMCRALHASHAERKLASRKGSSLAETVTNVDAFEKP